MRFVIISIALFLKACEFLNQTPAQLRLYNNNDSYYNNSVYSYIFMYKTTVFFCFFFEIGMTYMPNGK